jgi:hypothetical protein
MHIARARAAASVATVAVAMMAGAGPASHAATDLPAYDVELVVFENLDAEPQTESLLIEDDLRLPEQVVDFEGSGGLREARQQGFEPLEAEQGGLRQLVDRLNRSSRYRIILYRAWRQPGLPFETAVPVRIHGGTDYTGRYEPLRAKAMAPEAGLFTPAPGAVSIEPRPLEELDGTITVSLQRYLHVTTDLVFREPLTAPMSPTKAQPEGRATPAEDTDPRLPEEPAAPQQGPAQEAATAQAPTPRQAALIPGQPYLQPHVMQERRRMRSREIHYFDSPRFGLITLITPHEPEEKPER